MQPNLWLGYERNKVGYKQFDGIPELFSSLPFFSSVFSIIRSHFIYKHNLLTEDIRNDAV